MFLSYSDLRKRLFSRVTLTKVVTSRDVHGLAWISYWLKLKSKLKVMNLLKAYASPYVQTSSTWIIHGKAIVSSIKQLGDIRVIIIRTKWISYAIKIITHQRWKDQIFIEKKDPSLKFRTCIS